MEQVQITKWWKLFDRVIAVKQGASRPVTSKSLAEILICSGCGSRQWTVGTNSWRCEVCEKELPFTRAGILLN